MSLYVALLDANVLYPAPMRDLLLQLAVSNLFIARWSADIQREWIEALLRNEPHRDRADARADGRGCARLPGAGYEPLIPTLSLPDPEDRHVLAAAIAGNCDVIVTQNLQHFPAAVLAPFGIAAQPPDDLLGFHLDAALTTRRSRAPLAGRGLYLDALRVWRRYQSAGT